MAMTKIKITVSAILDVDMDDYQDVIDGECTPAAVADHIYYQVLGGPEVLDTVLENEFVVFTEPAEPEDVIDFDETLEKQVKDRDARYGDDEEE